VIPAFAGITVLLVRLTVGAPVLIARLAPAAG
jgi:hypothetical protein